MQRFLMETTALLSDNPCHKGLTKQSKPARACGGRRPAGIGVLERDESKMADMIKQEQQGRSRNVTSSVASIISRRIIDGTYRPGERLIEADLAKDLGVGRGSVRKRFGDLKAIVTSPSNLIAERWLRGRLRRNHCHVASAHGDCGARRSCGRRAHRTAWQS